jgi:structure-specific recognition protein 1
LQFLYLKVLTYIYYFIASCFCPTLPIVAVRFYIPPDPDIDPNDKSIPYPAELLQQKIMKTANIRKTTGDILVEFDQSKGTFLTPRGRYAIELYDWFLRLRGQKYDYKIKYDDINRLFLLPKPDEVHMAFVIALDKPIRQGQQRYQYLVLQATKDPDEVTVNLEEETLQKEYGGELQPVMRGSLSNLVAKTFKVIAKKKVFIPGKFSNANQQACIKCAYRANEGLLYPLEKQFVFIHKPPILVRFNEVESVEFQRYAGGQGSTRNFDLCVNLKSNATPAGSGIKEYTFMGIDRTEYTGIYNFLNGKKIKIKNLEGVGAVVEPTRQAPVYNEDEIYGGPDPDGDEESEDDDYGEADAKEDEKKIQEEMDSDESDIDDEDLGSEVDEELDSDLEEMRKDKKSKAPKKKASKSDESPRPKKKAKKGKKDPNAPKKPMTAYMLFSNAMRPTVKAENPEAEFGTIAKLIGEKYKNMSPEEREKWNEKAATEKKRYESEMADYSAPDDSDDDAGKKKPKKDPNAPKKPTSAYLHFSSANRARISKENPDASFGDVVSVAWGTHGCRVFP